MSVSTHWSGHAAATKAGGDGIAQAFIGKLPPANPLTSDLSDGTMQTVSMQCSWGGELTAAVSADYDTAAHVSLFIPGFTGSKEDFLGFLPHLIAQTKPSESRAFVAYSQRGQADSARPQGDCDYALEDFVNDAREVLMRLGAERRPIDVLGHSFGGVVARRLSIACPSLVRSLTLLSSGAKPIAETPQSRAGMQAIRDHGSSIIFTSKNPGATDEPQDDPYLEMFRQRAHRTSVENLLSIASILTDYDDVTDSLKATGIPISIMFGENDPVWPHAVYREEARRLAVTPIVFPGAGHSAQLDVPDALAKALSSFWSKNRGQ
ncbi:alpha/beta fold hydrolase [Bifidobacterium sp.]|uniref:alpha/beta fold hydrolase n=1 Tax=Bifidobacterium sp. TaxID=41200 RepID=UPI0039EB51C8